MTRRLSRPLALIALAVLARPASAHPAWGIVVDAAGRLYFCDLFHGGGTVWSVEPGGRPAPVVRGRHSHDLRLDASGLTGTHLDYLAATREWESRLWRVDAAGGPAREVIPPTRVVLDFWGDQFLPDFGGGVLFAYGPELRIWEAPGRARSFAGTQARGKADGRGPAARFGSLGGFARGPDGSVFVADDDAIRRVAADGTVTTWARGLTDTRNGPGRLFGLAVDDRGAVVVADPGGRRVLKVDRPGAAPVVVLTSEAPWEPYGVACHRGAVFVLESGLVPPSRFVGPRVRRIDADGGVSIVARIPDGPDGEPDARRPDR